MKTTLIDAMQTYFRGEQNMSLMVAAAGVLLVGVSILIYRMATVGSVGRGLLIPLAVLSLLFVGAGIANSLNNAKRLTDIPQRYETEPTQVLTSENTRMVKVSAMWMPLKIVWSVLAFVGIVLLLTASTSTWAGVGLGLLIWGTAGHVVDTFAKERNDQYAEVISQNSPDIPW